jgi:hypothetical protein
MNKFYNRNAKDSKDDLHVSLVFAYSKKMDQLVLANNITNNGVEESSLPTCLKEVMIDLDDMMTNLEEPML